MFLDDVDERYEFDEPPTISMSPLFGDAVSLQVVRVDVSSVVVMVGTMALNEFVDAAGRGCFHLDDEEPAVEWQPGTSVDLTLALRRPVAHTFSGGDELVAALVRADPSPLHATEAWRLMEATQTVEVPHMPDASVQVGLRSSWADR
jgi:hypothetical protein